MLYTLAVLLLIAWLLGVVGTYAIGAVAHVLLVDLADAVHGRALERPRDRRVADGIIAPISALAERSAGPQVSARVAAKCHSGSFKLLRLDPDHQGLVVVRVPRRTRPTPA